MQVSCHSNHGKRRTGVGSYKPSILRWQGGGVGSTMLDVMLLSPALNIPRSCMSCTPFFKLEPA